MRTALRNSTSQWTAAWLLVGAAAIPGAPSGEAPEPDSESCAGFDIPLLAEALAQQATLRARLGERPGDVVFDRWLAGRGRTRRQFDAAYPGWWQRFRNDPTGQIEARLRRIYSAWLQQFDTGGAAK